MKTSSEAEVRKLYDESADGYAKMMDAEIDLPIYSETLGRLAKRISDMSGPLIDTSCGSGHMLSLYHDRVDPQRPLIGIDLSLRMVAIAAARLGASAEVMTGDMRALTTIQEGSAAAILSFFALHHLDPGAVRLAFREWRRVLQSGGQLVIALWEGNGPIDYGESSDVVALRYAREEIETWVQNSGFSIDRSVTEPVEEMPMQAIYLEATNGEPLHVAAEIVR